MLHTSAIIYELCFLIDERKILLNNFSSFVWNQKQDGMIAVARMKWSKPVHDIQTRVSRTLTSSLRKQVCHKL